MCISFFLCQVNAQSSSQLQQEADKYFEAGDYRNALQLYRQADFEASNNKDLRLRVGISLYETNDVDGAARTFQTLVNEGKTDPVVFLYLGKSYQAKNQFTEAIANYKKYLKRTEGDEPMREWAKDELVRCANGQRLKYADQNAYLENAGPSINTEYAEFGLKFSPTMIDKVYFNSDRNGNVDIYAAELVNGRWSTPVQLPTHINSTMYDEVAGFSTDGQILYYITTEGDGFAFKTDTFSGDAGTILKGYFQSVFADPEKNADIHFFNDSIALFASNQEGGYGGFDLYVSVLENGSWSAPLNLGPTINTFYDERFPFLTRDGLTLFYSSNNLESIGGYDVFTSSFDNVKLKWSAPMNVGMPVNSTLDDTHMMLSPDGMSAFISSNRKEGQGDFDLYRVFFKQPVRAHQMISADPSFYQTLKKSGTEVILAEPAPEKPVEVKEYFLSHLFIDQNGDVLTPQNVKKLDLLANLLLVYPRIKVELSSFEIPSGQKTFNLYFSIKKTEQAADYLVRKGISNNRLILKGYGSSFPLATNLGGATPGAVYLKLNHRIEVGLHDFESEPLLAHIENIPVPENLRDPKGIKFDSIRHGFYYSVQIASITQILQNMQLETVDEMFIEVSNEQGSYRYMVGMLPTFTQAASKLQEMINLGFTDAFIVPYHNGIRLTRERANELSAQFPDLINYIEFTR